MAATHGNRQGGEPSGEQTLFSISQLCWFCLLAAPPACASPVSLRFACAGLEEEEEALCGTRWHRGWGTGDRTELGTPAPGVMSLRPLGRDRERPQLLGPGGGLSQQWGAVAALSPGGAEGMCQPQQPVLWPQLMFLVRLLSSAITRAHARLCRLPGPVCTAQGDALAPGAGCSGEGSQPRILLVPISLCPSTGQT